MARSEKLIDTDNCSVFKSVENVDVDRVVDVCESLVVETDLRKSSGHRYLAAFEVGANAGRWL